MNELMENSLAIFQGEFRNVMERFNDNRNFIFNQSDNENFSLEYYDLDMIEIHYNQQRIISEYLEIGLRNEVFLETFQFLAGHEYCHNLIAETSDSLETLELYQNERINLIERFSYIGIENKFREYYADYKVQWSQLEPIFQDSI